MSIRVLIAGDHAMIRKRIRTVLSPESVEVCEEAENGSEAVDKAVQLRPDLVILDGFEAAKNLHRVMPDVPILFYSMHDSAQLIKKVKRAGVQGYVSKSEVIHTLPRAVNALVIQKTTFFPEVAAAS